MIQMIHRLTVEALLFFVFLLKARFSFNKTKQSFIFITLPSLIVFLIASFMILSFNISSIICSLPTFSFFIFKTFIPCLFIVSVLLFFNLFEYLKILNLYCYYVYC